MKNRALIVGMILCLKAWAQTPPGTNENPNEWTCCLNARKKGQIAEGCDDILKKGNCERIYQKVDKMIADGNEWRQKQEKVGFIRNLAYGATLIGLLGFLFYKRRKKGGAQKQKPTPPTRKPPQGPKIDLGGYE